MHNFSDPKPIPRLLQSNNYEEKKSILSASIDSATFLHSDIDSISTSPPHSFLARTIWKHWQSFVQWNYAKVIICLVVFFFLQFFLWLFALIQFHLVLLYFHFCCADESTQRHVNRHSFWVCMCWRSIPIAIGTIVRLLEQGTARRKQWSQMKHMCLIFCCLYFVVKICHSYFHSEASMRIC